MAAAIIRRERATEWFALAWLLVLGALALVGPYGLLAWGEKSAALQQRNTRIAQLTQQHKVLQNRVNRLDPAHVDPDLASELVRKNLNVARPDEYVINLDQQP